MAFNFDPVFTWIFVAHSNSNYEIKWILEEILNYQGNNEI